MQLLESEFVVWITSTVLVLMLMNNELKQPSHCNRLNHLRMCFWNIVTYLSLYTFSYSLLFSKLKKMDLLTYSDRFNDRFYVSNLEF